jgi:hypothetical protein
MPGHCLARFKPIQMIQNGSNGFKVAQTLADSKGAFPAPKIGNKIWLERA